MNISELIVDWHVTVYRIYKFTNLTNGKGYIGYTENIIERFNTHRRRGETHIPGVDKSVFHGALHLYGWDCFSKEILYCSLDGLHTLKEMEPYFITLHNTYRPSPTGHGYNMTLGGEGTPGLYISEETRAKMSESRMGEKNHFYGKTHDDETRQIMSERAKERDPKTGKDAPFFGKQRTDEWKQKNAELHAESYFITFPDGHTETITNLRAFCRENKLTAPLMIAVSKGIQYHHKQFKCKKIDTHKL